MYKDPESSLRKNDWFLIQSNIYKCTILNKLGENMA
jgi:hypothetical protein